MNDLLRSINQSILSDELMRIREKFKFVSEQNSIYVVKLNMQIHY